jgi:hypothetical protein
MVLTRPGFVRAASRPPRRPPDQAALSYNRPAATSPTRCPFITAWSKNASSRSILHAHSCVGRCPECAVAGERVEASRNESLTRARSSVRVCFGLAQLAG